MTGLVKVTGNIVENTITEMILFSMAVRFMVLVDRHYTLSDTGRASCK